MIRILTPFLLLFLISCEEPRKQVAPEIWVSKNHSEWPQIVLTNSGVFKGHTSMNGASSFLIKNSNDVLLCLTAKHLLGVNGGVEPEVLADKFNSVIKYWKVYPRTKSNESLLFDNVPVKGLDQPGLDWLILKQSSSKVKKLPSLPLKVRNSRVEIGEKVYLVGVQYSDRDLSQSVYEGVVNGRGYEDRFKYELTTPVTLAGFSGAPILDMNGHVVGVMTVWFKTKMKDGKNLEAGGEDIASIFDLIESIKQ